MGVRRFCDKCKTETNKLHTIDIYEANLYIELCYDTDGGRGCYDDFINWVRRWLGNE